VVREVIGRTLPFIVPRQRRSEAPGAYDEAGRSSVAATRLNAVVRSSSGPGQFMLWEIAR
jgi:hypothetical protein